MTKRKQDTQMIDPTNTFESDVQSLRPFIKDTAIADKNRAKIWIQGAFDAPALDTVIAASEGRIQRGGHSVLFVDYGDLTAENALAVLRGTDSDDSEWAG